MSEIAVNGSRFRTLVEPIGKKRFDTFLRRLSVMGWSCFIRSCSPSWLARNWTAARETLARVLESYLVRRMICNADTRGYGALCLTLLGARAGRRWRGECRRRGACLAN